MSLISLPLLIFLPLIAVIVLLTPLLKNNSIYIRRFATGFSVVYFLYSIMFYVGYVPVSGNQENFSGAFKPVLEASIPLLNTKLLNQAGIHIAFGVDAISITMIILTTFIMMLAILGSKLYITKHHKLFYILLFILESILIAIFSTTDMFVFFGLWELELIPMYLLISIWGNRNASKSALKFVLYTFGGSLFMLLGFLLIYYSNFALSGVISSSFVNLNMYNANIVLQLLISVFLLIGFGVKIPLIPLHRWLADTHTDACTPVSMILAGILLKLGVYGMLRFNFGVLPASFAYLIPVLGFIAVLNIIVGAALAYNQKSIKKIIAYSSISQMGIIVLGLSAMSNIGYLGAIYHSVSHGIVAAGLFFIVGIIKNKFRTVNINRLSGIASVAPGLYGFSVFIALAAMGVPFLSGFIGEFLSIYGAIISSSLFMKLYGVCAVCVLMLTALYVLRFIHEVYFGLLPIKYQNIQDIAIHEFIVLGSVSFAILLLGCFPAILLDFLYVN